MQHQGIFIRDYLRIRHCKPDEVAELTGIPEDQLNEYLEKSVVPGDVVAKNAFHIAARLPEDFLSCRGTGSNLGNRKQNPKATLARS